MFFSASTSLVSCRAADVGAFVGPRRRGRMEWWWREPRWPHGVIIYIQQRASRHPGRAGNGDGCFRGDPESGMFIWAYFPCPRQSQSRGTDVCRGCVFDVARDRSSMGMMDIRSTLCLHFHFVGSNRLCSSSPIVLPSWIYVSYFFFVQPSDTLSEVFLLFHTVQMRNQRETIQPNYTK